MWNILKIITCHLLGDYVLQTEYIANTKGSNWYHMFIHCFLYCVPFVYAFGFDSRVVEVFILHAVIDTMATRYDLIGEADNQMVCYVSEIALYLL